MSKRRLVVLIIYLINNVLALTKKRKNVLFTDLYCIKNGMPLIILLVNNGIVNSVDVN